MAIPAAAVWEMRANAGNSGLQGGFFNAARGGTDYSQQDTAQVSVTDIATDAAGTTLTSATGAFAAGMVGNGIYLTGGGATAGRYEITAVTNATTVTIDRSAGASKTSVTGRVGGAVALDATLPVAGNTAWLRADGTHTLAGNMAMTAGTEALAVTIEGYGSTRGDKPSGTSRPLIACGNYAFTLSNYGRGSYLRFTGSTTTVVQTGYASVLLACTVVNSSATAGRAAVTAGQYGLTALNCEFESTNGTGLSSNYGSTCCIGCYLHDSASYGVSFLSGAGGVALRCIFDGCGSGVYGTTFNGLTVVGCVFYNCTYGVQVTTGDCTRVLNCVFKGNTTALSFTDAHQGENFEDWNCFHGNTTDRANIAAGANSCATDPQFADAAGANFATSAAALRNAALPGAIEGSATVNYEDVGMQAQATGGGGTRAYASGL